LDQNVSCDTVFFFDASQQDMPGMDAGVPEPLRSAFCEFQYAAGAVGAA
jgi:hypothetical protein